MKRYRLALPGKADLDRIWTYLARNSGLVAADRVIDSITNQFPILAAMPDAGVLREEIEPGLRGIPVGKYIIYYCKGERDGILIARVIHGMRDQELAWRKSA